jgi:hypothetical protein
MRSKNLQGNKAQRYLIQFMLQVAGRLSNKETPRLDGYVQETNLAGTQRENRYNR